MHGLDITKHPLMISTVPYTRLQTYDGNSLGVKLHQVWNVKLCLSIDPLTDGHKNSVSDEDGILHDGVGHGDVLISREGISEQLHHVLKDVREATDKLLKYLWCVDPEHIIGEGEDKLTEVDCGLTEID